VTNHDAISHLKSFADVVLLDTLEQALIGYTQSWEGSPRPIYDLEHCVILIQRRLKWNFPGAADVIRDGLVRGWCTCAGAPVFAILTSQDDESTFRQQGG